MTETLRELYIDTRAEVEYAYGCYQALVNEHRSCPPWDDAPDSEKAKYRSWVPPLLGDGRQACLDALAERAYVYYLINHYADTGSMLTPWQDTDADTRLPFEAEADADLQTVLDDAPAGAPIPVAQPVQVVRLYTGDTVLDPDGKCSGLVFKFEPAPLGYSPRVYRPENLLGKVS